MLRQVNTQHRELGTLTTSGSDSSSRHSPLNFKIMLDRLDKMDPAYLHNGGDGRHTTGRAAERRTGFWFWAGECVMKVGVVEHSATRCSAAPPLQCRCTQFVFDAIRLMFVGDAARIAEHITCCTSWCVMRHLNH